MIVAIVRNIIRFRFLVFSVIGAGILLSFYAIQKAPLDAIPDISDPQIVIYVKWPRSPRLIETEVVEPLMRAMIGSPDIQTIRGTSHMGYSFIYVILKDASRKDEVKQLVVDRINTIRPQLPRDASVTLGPNASSMGWIYQYALIDNEQTHDLRELRLLNESLIKPALQTVPGVAEARFRRRSRGAVSNQDLSTVAGERRYISPSGHYRRGECVSGNGWTHDRSDQP